MEKAHKITKPPPFNFKIMKDKFENNCRVNEQTADGEYIGRCWFKIENGKCPRHGEREENKKGI